jgi:hypothetical protein
MLELGVQGGGGEGEVWAVLELGVQEGRVGEVRGSARAGCTGRRRRGRSTGSARAGCTGRTSWRSTG